MVVIARREGKLYQMTFIEIYGVDATNFMHSRTGGGTVELWHC